FGAQVTVHPFGLCGRIDGGAVVAEALVLYDERHVGRSTLEWQRSAERTFVVVLDEQHARESLMYLHRRAPMRVRVIPVRGCTIGNAVLIGIGCSCGNRVMRM